jgi:hypothetical protein
VALVAQAQLPQLAQQVALAAMVVKVLLRRLQIPQAAMAAAVDKAVPLSMPSLAVMAVLVAMAVRGVLLAAMVGLVLAPIHSVVQTQVTAVPAVTLVR